MSLGVDPIACPQKICNFNCLYCQLGETCLFQSRRKVFIPTRAVFQEIQRIPSSKIDHITFSGCGEPTLAKNLGAMIRAVKRVRKEKIAVITNSSLLHRADVQKDLMGADFVLAKLDAWDEESFVMINRGIHAASFKDMMKGMRAFRKKFKGKFALQIMFMEENLGHARAIAALAKKIDPDEVQINTPLRPSATKPLTRKQMSAIKRAFLGLRTICVYDVPVKPYHPMDEARTAARHGKFRS